MKIPDDALPLIDFAKQLGVTPNTVRRWAWTGLRNGAVKLTVVRRGVAVLVSQADYEDFQKRFDEWRPTPIVMPSSRERRRSEELAERLLQQRGALSSGRERSRSQKQAHRILRKFNAI